MLKVEAIQSGLQAPVPKTWALDSNEGPPKETAEIKRLLEDCDFLRAPEPPVSRSAPDRGTISILVTTSKGSRRLTFALGAVPKEFAALVEFVASRLQWRPRKP